MKVYVVLYLPYYSDTYGLSNVYKNEEDAEDEASKMLKADPDCRAYVQEYEVKE